MPFGRHHAVRAFSRAKPWHGGGFIFSPRRRLAEESQSPIPTRAFRPSYF